MLVNRLMIQQKNAQFRFTTAIYAIMDCSSIQSAISSRLPLFSLDLIYLDSPIFLVHDSIRPLVCGGGLNIVGKNARYLVRELRRLGIQ